MSETMGEGDGRASLSVDSAAVSSGPPSRFRPETLCERNWGTQPRGILKIRPTTGAGFNKQLVLPLAALVVKKKIGSAFKKNWNAALVR